MKKQNVNTAKLTIANIIVNGLIKEWNKMISNNAEFGYIYYTNIVYVCNKYEDVIVNDEKVNEELIWIKEESSNFENADEYIKSKCALLFAKTYTNLDNNTKDLLFSYSNEYNRLQWENPINTEKDGYNYITSNFEDVEDYKNDYKEFLDLHNVNSEEYTINEYASNNGLILMEEYKQEYIIAEP